MSFDLPALPNEISLKDAVEFIVDNRGKTAPTEPKGIALIATNCVNNVDLYPKKLNLRYVSQETYNTWFRSHPVPGDILLTNKGSQNGAICLVPNPVDFCIAQDMVALRADPQKITPLYLFAALRSDLVQKRIKALNVDAVIPHLKKTDFNKLLIPLPDRNVQDSVGMLYFELSSRIELLRETNATLEAIAQALFKSWFVDFDPVRAKLEGRAPVGMDEATARLFPDSFEESELGLVPTGWRVLRLGDATERITKGTTPTTLKRPFVEVGINFVKAESMTGDGGFIPEKFAHIDDETHELLRRSQLKEGDVLISIAGTIGRIAVMTKDYLPANTNQAVALVRPRPSVFPSGLVNRFLRLSESQQTMVEKVVQAVQANLSLGTLSDLKVVVPAESVVVKLYESGLAQIDVSWTANDQRVRTLATLRDTLLPRLISGQLRLPEAHAAAEEALA